MRQNTTSLLTLIAASALLFGAPAFADNKAPDANNQAKSASHSEQNKMSSEKQMSNKASDREDARARMGSVEFDREESTQEIQTTLRRAISQALEGDFDGYLGYLSEKDRERFEKESGTQELKPVASSWQESWKSAYGKDVSSSIKEHKLALSITPTGKETASATLQTEEGKMAFNLVRGGWFDTGWRIDVDDSISRSELFSNLQRHLTRVQQIEVRKNANQEQQVAELLLKPLSASS